MSDNKQAVASSSGNPSPEGNQQEKGFFKKYGGQIVQMIFFWMIMRAITGGWNNNNQNTNTQINGASQPQTVHTKSGSRATLRDYVHNVPDNVHFFPHPLIPHADLPESFVPLWQPNTPMEVSVYISENEYFTNYRKEPDFKTSGLFYGQWFEGREGHLDIPATKTIQHNGTVYAHIFVNQDKMPIDPTDAAFNPDSIVYYRHVLTKFYPQKTQVKQKNLLKKENEDRDEEEVEKEKGDEENNKTDMSAGIVGLGTGILGNLTRRGPLVAHWQQNVTLTLLSDNKNVIPKNGLQPPVMKYVQFDTQLARTPSGKQGFYRPILFPNDFWTLQQNAFAVNESVTSLPLTIRIEPISLWKFNIFATLDDSMKQQANSPLGGMTAGDIDEVKRMFLETNPVLLGTTIVVSLLHSLFEMLAFKNDIAFWKKKQNSTGISVRTLIVNIFFQIVIFLYLLDNNQETSWMVLISQGFGLLLEIWKVFKALKYELVWTPGSLLPKLGLQEQNAKEKEEEDETAKYDAIAFKYLKWISYPLLAGYAIYSLYYEEHKSWYSYVLKTLVEFVYMFGFITMLPQLYINYRLKSVAHMPWKTLMYKSLNTFIDDLFAFVIKMPTLHRLACLRDDVVFFVYLYQRHVYKVDHRRANEYGQVGEEEVEDKNQETKKDK
ncbi:cleft lip and palate transmembrane protein 1-domain-containing protein [Cokeromyces recurvatus]|uniref:cleft lip and palate transmembrane protein 1-domain-containing protein n=1 Tax=Cokeromyces recurvatus TaxID=90255 RepID=UPI00221F81EF|nr:cleft lip and palate transmembrane protein 1-domain-containing protein [Cokeromyces recurvatus]KAI7904476.1 cleft lip and palate transmembrane protein 1-domain-containing protein [Cokeromyces recurvatus]